MTLQGIGLAEKPTSALVDAVQAAIQVFEHCLIQLNQTRADFSLLFRWLQTTMRHLMSLEANSRMKLCSDDLRRLARFLQSVCGQDMRGVNLADALSSKLFEVHEPSRTVDARDD